MARIRTIKPEYWSHPIMARLPAETQLLALALLNHADDHGYFHADAAIVRGACCPFRDGLASVSRDLAKLSQAGWIEVREHPIQGDIGLVVNWSKHQKVDHPRDSKIKTYYDREAVAKVREELALDQGSGIRDQGREGTPPPPTTEVVAKDQDDLTSEAPKAPASSDADRWPYEQGLPWAQGLKRLGCKVGPGNWQNWKRLVTEHGARVIEIAKRLPAGERWDDKVEEALGKSAFNPDDAAALEARWAKRIRMNNDAPTVIEEAEHDGQ